VETDRSGLIGGYIGQSALKTKDQIKKAMGGVLFIDEAYSLFTESGQDYGNEVIATLVKEMEDNRDNLVCIFAGYTDEMDKMINMNPGLRDRVQFYVDFPDYTETELMQIFEKFCSDNGYRLTKPARSAVVDEFSLVSQRKDKSFSNGRAVRRLFDRIRIKQAQRADSNVITDTDVAAAFAEPDIAAMFKGSRVKIGFTV
jgi:Cdc6-like AAA superfamily ATPase